MWRSKRDEERLACVFFERQLPKGARPFKTLRRLELDTGAGRKLVEQVMRAHNAAFG